MYERVQSEYAGSGSKCEDPDGGRYRGKPTGTRIPGYPSITIEADNKDVQMNLMNPEGNPCYFIFEIVLNDTDETIYTSKMVEP